MKLKHLIHAALLLLITPLTQAQFATGDVAVFEKKSTAGFELKAVEDTGLILPLANGGLGASLTDPGADRIPFWDDSGTTVTWLTLGTGLSITGTTINASAVLGDADYGDIVVSSSGTAINIDTGRKSTGALGSGDAGKLATFASGGYLMGTVVSAGDSVTPGNDYITLETDAVNGQVIRGYHTGGMDEHEYIVHLPTTSMSDTFVEWWLPEALPTVNGQVLTGQTDGTTAWATASGGSPGGSSGAVQYNNGGAFGGVSGITLSTGALSSIALGSGSTSAPSITFSGGGSTTGIYSDTSGNIMFSSAGVNRVWIDSNGTIQTSGSGMQITNGNLIVGYTYLRLDGRALNFGVSDDVGIGRDGAAATLQMGTDSSTPVAQLFKGADGSGTNIAGGTMTFAGGRGTGSAVGGSVVLQTTPAGSSGATAGTLTTRVEVTGDGQIILSPKAAPSSASDTGTAGEIRFDSSYIYYCTATNTWKRVAIATW